MTWQEICNEPTLQDLPFKVETNEYGQVVMSPASNQHGRFQTRIAILLDRQISAGEVISECSVDTEKGVKVADVAWLSAEFLVLHGYATPYPAAPELCIEVVSPSNSRRELTEKLVLYFQRGAREVWICNASGELRFHTQDGESSASILFPGFPQSI